MRCVWCVSLSLDWDSLADKGEHVRSTPAPPVLGLVPAQMWLSVSICRSANECFLGTSGRHSNENMSLSHCRTGRGVHVSFCYLTMNAFKTQTVSSLSVHA